MNCTTAQETTSTLAAQEKMLEAWRLHSLGFECAAASSARTAIELAVRERCGHLARYERRRRFNDLLDLMKTYGIVSGKQRNRIARLFSTLSRYVSGWETDESAVYRLLVAADAIQHQVAKAKA